MPYAYNMNITTQHTNKLLHRTELTATLEAEKNPGIQAVTEQIASALKADPSLVVIKKLAGHFGNHTLTVHAYAYTNATEKARIEQKAKQKKEAPK